MRTDNIYDSIFWSPHDFWAYSIVSVLSRNGDPSRTHPTKVLLTPTWEYGEYGSKGIQLEAIDDVAKVTNLNGHEDAPGGQQKDVQALRNDAQPQHPCQGTNKTVKNNCKAEEEKANAL